MIDFYDYIPFWTSLNAVFSYVVFICMQVVAAIQSHPILLLTFGFFILGGAIAIFGRILSRD